MYQAVLEPGAGGDDGVEVRLRRAFRGSSIGNPSLRIARTTTSQMSPPSAMTRQLVRLGLALCVSLVVGTGLLTSRLRALVAGAITVLDVDLEERDEPDCSYLLVQLRLSEPRGET